MEAAAKVPARGITNRAHPHRRPRAMPACEVKRARSARIKRAAGAGPNGFTLVNRRLILIQDINVQSHTRFVTNQRLFFLREEPSISTSLARYLVMGWSSTAELGAHRCKENTILIQNTDSIIIN